MQSISDPLNLLYEDGSWFARAHELHLWLLRCDENLRKPALALVPKLEFHADNDRAWALLLDAHTRADDGWQLRANNLAADWGRRVEAFAAEAVVLGPVEAAHGPTGLAAFRATLAALLRSMAAPLAGLVVVLAPSITENGEQLADELSSLVSDPALRNCRWVLILDLDVAPPQATLDALGPKRCLSTTLVVDDAQQRSDFAAMLGTSDPTRFGTVWPLGVDPPARVDDPPPLAQNQRDAVLRAEGIDPALIERGPELRAKVLGAAIAMKDGRGVETIALQREACQLCARLGLYELQVITQISLASYLSGLEQRPAAKRVIRATIEVARARALPRSESQAHLSLGLLCSLDREYEAGALAYIDAARAAEAGEEPQLAIEAWRMAGQLAAQLGRDQSAIEAFGQAIRIASGTAPSQVQGSSAAEAARQLASVYERHGMAAQAVSLHTQADAMEREGEASDASE